MVGPSHLSVNARISNSNSCARRISSLRIDFEHYNTRLTGCELDRELKAVFDISDEELERLLDGVVGRGLD